VIDAECGIVLEAISVFHIARGDALGSYLVSEYKLASRKPRPMISVTTIAEILRVVHRKKYKAYEIETVKRLLGKAYHFVPVLDEIVEEFALLGAATDLNGEPRYSSKVWVAATCSAIAKGTRKAALLTCDSDYLAFKKQGLQVEYVDPSPYRKGFASIA